MKGAKERAYLHLTSANSPRIHPCERQSYLPARAVHEIMLGIHNYPLLSLERLFKKRVATCQRNAVVSTFDNKVNLGQHAAHLRQSRRMMPEII